MLVELLLSLAMLGPSSRSLGNRPGSGTNDDERLARIAGFSSVLISQVNRAIGSENLPLANGISVDPGLFVTIGLDGAQIYDRAKIPLQGGRNNDRTASPACVSGCSAAFYDAFQLEWLRMAVEGATRTVRVPERLHIAAHSQVPMGTVIDVAYAASESRPVLPPIVTLLVNSQGRGVRALPIFLLPPEGLELPQGSAALGLTIKFGPSGITVDGADSTLGREQRVADLSALPALLKAVGKRHPNKEVIILEPEAGVTVEQFVSVIQMVRERFPRIVLSAGQRVLL